MNDIRKINIWKNDGAVCVGDDMLAKADIEVLGLKPRSFNCLKRVSCNTVGDVIALMEDEEHGLSRIRNLGVKSEAEIREKVEEFREMYRKEHPEPRKKTTIIRPAKKMWDTEIEAFHLSGRAMENFRKCGIRQVKDLYRNSMSCEPGWYAVRELFEKMK